jgi:hypothetical protein
MTSKSIKIINWTLDMNAGASRAGMIVQLLSENENSWMFHNCTWEGLFHCLSMNWRWQIFGWIEINSLVRRTFCLAWWHRTQENFTHGYAYYSTMMLTEKASTRNLIWLHFAHKSRTQILTKNLNFQHFLSFMMFSINLTMHLTFFQHQRPSTDWSLQRIWNEQFIGL